MGCWRFSDPNLPSCSRWALAHYAEWELSLLFLPSASHHTDNLPTAFSLKKLGKNHTKDPIFAISEAASIENIVLRIALKANFSRILMDSSKGA